MNKSTDDVNQGSSSDKKPMSKRRNSKTKNSPIKTTAASANTAVLEKEKPELIELEKDTTNTVEPENVTEKEEVVTQPVDTEKDLTDDNKTVTPAVDEEEYAILYYNQKPKDFGSASIWFLFAYALLCIPLIIAVEQILNGIGSFSLPDAEPLLKGVNFNKEIFYGSSIIGAISFLCGVAGLVTAKKYDYPIWKSIVGILGVILIAVVALIIFV
jgi:hypothetical protein